MKNDLLNLHIFFYRLKDGVQLINGIPTKKFPMLLDCIQRAEGPNLFTPEELTKLQDSLHLTEDKLQLLIQSLVYIFKQSSKIILKPTDFQKHLTDVLGFETEKAEEFVKAWSSETKKHFGDFENRCKLNNISWELNLELNKGKPVPKARLQLDVTNFEGNADNVIFELNEEELVSLYGTLENVQTKLDKLQSIE